MFDLAIMTIQGFQQETHRHNGITDLWEYKLRKYAAPKTLIMTPLIWKDNPKDTAKWLMDLHIDKIVVIAYSWGAGWFFRRFQKYYDKNINHVILCDPVKRMGWLPTSLSPVGLFSAFSMTRLPKMEIESNVQNVSRFYQTINKPSSHDLNIKSSNTKLVLDKQLEVVHGCMDNHPDFHNHVVDVIDNIRS